MARRSRIRSQALENSSLDTSGPTFAVFLTIIVGGLIYFPMLILGPSESASSDEAGRPSLSYRPASRQYT
jgi:K+-transporting ATPase A subunit